jgi:glycosyltransferase involved in cell wall biosynthesis
MRVLHLAGEYPPWRIGGIATYLENLARRQRVTHELGVVVLRGTGYREDPADEPGDTRVQVLDLDVTAIGDAPVLEHRILEALVPHEGLLAEPWDVLHVHDWYGVVPALALLGRGARRMVMTAHLPLRHGFTYANHPVPMRWKSRLEALGFRAAGRVVAPSHHVATLLEREYDVPRAKLRVVHNGVDVERFAPNGARAGPPTILVVSRLTEQKGLDLLLRIVAAVRARVPSVRLEIAGQGSAREALEADVARLGLENAVTLHGYVAHHDLPALYRRASVFVSTSIYEPFGLTTLEAMACGVPVVVSGLGGTSEFVRDDEEGFVRWPHEPAAFADAVVTLLLEPDRAARMGEQARARAVALDWARTTEQLERTYREASRP